MNRPAEPTDRVRLLSPMTGAVVPLSEVDDPIFSERIMGDGLAVRPASPRVTAPLAGRVAKVFPGGHGIAIETAAGVRVLIHVGLGTVALEGEGFTVHTAEGDAVEPQQLLLTIDLERMARLGIDLVSPVVVISGQAAWPVAAGRVAHGDPFLDVYP